MTARARSIGWGCRVRLTVPRGKAREALAYQVLYWDSLPDCRECRCVVIDGFLEASRQARMKHQERIKQEAENG